MVYYYFVEPIRNILVPQVGHTPWVAGLPFFMVIALASFISLFIRHFTQYACISWSPFLRINYSTLYTMSISVSSFTLMNSKLKYRILFFYMTKGIKLRIVGWLTKRFFVISEEAIASFVWGSWKLHPFKTSSLLPTTWLQVRSKIHVIVGDFELSTYIFPVACHWQAEESVFWQDSGLNLVDNVAIS